ncbi:MAG: ATP-dependent zinc metalloprotease FtsH [Kiritimatiellaeota bacterium]|nr:ATP-dependent zinc metalloprotease FtsH [Kiritimatiellota bacterium]
MSDYDKKPDHPPPPPPPPNRKEPDDDDDSPMFNRRFAFSWLLIIGVALMAFWLFNGGMPGRKPEVLGYREYQEKVEAGEIADAKVVRVSSTEMYVTGSYTNDPKRTFRVSVDPNERTPEYLREYGVNVKRIESQSNVWPMLLWNVAPILLLIGFFYFIFSRQMRGGGGGNPFSFGKSRARMLNQDKKKHTFGDVAGIKEAKEEVQEIIEFLKAPAKFQKLGGRIPKGVLLVGPPGTGKTLLAKAIAGEAGVPFFSISGSDFVEMFVGVGASRVRDMFEQGKKHAPCLLFIDEIDAVGRQRFSGIGGGHDEREQTLNALLVEMDGFETNEGVIIIAATNRPDVLDQALLRPGRFDRQIVIDLPTLDGRVEILKLHAQKVKLAEDVELRRIARGTPGFSGADLANLINEAALIAARLDKESIGEKDLEEARDKVMWGRERRSHAMTEEERRKTAWHEAGHAVAQVLLEHTEPLHKVTIIPRGMALGMTMALPEKDVLNRTKSEFEDELVVCMAGQLAEKIHTGDVSTGARMDIRMASDIARKMVCEYGMSNLGMQAFGENQELMFLGRELNRTQHHSEATAQRIDAEVTAILERAHQRAETIVNENKEKLDQLVAKLMELETMDGRDVVALVAPEKLECGGLPPLSGGGLPPCEMTTVLSKRGGKPPSQSGGKPPHSINTEKLDGQGVRT